MNFKNKITNLLGIIFWITAIKIAYSKNPNVSFFIILVIIGGALFLFKNERIKGIIDNIIKLLTTKITKNK
jgi:hypothetical protein